ncbi:MAG: M1 family aminopeptidase, partial [Anaerolineales bacterium]
MSSESNQNGARNLVHHRLLLIVLIAVSIPLVLVVEQRLLSPPAEEQVQFLQDQRSVLRSNYQDDIESLESAPRYTLAADIDPETSSYQGQVEILYKHSGEGCLPEVGLMLYANATSIYGGSLEVEQVSVGGQETTFEQVTSTALKVPLSECLSSGSSLVLRANFAGRLSGTGEAGYGILSSNERGLALSGWYPMLSAPIANVEQEQIPAVGDALHTDISLVEASLTVPAGYQAITTGEAEIIAADGSVEWRVISGPARELAVLLLDDPQPASQQVDGVELRFFPSPASSDFSDPTSIEMAAEIFRQFQDFYGPYPYRQLDIVEWPVTIGGYEFSGLVLVDQGMRAAGNRVDFEFLLAHELAHQWWYLLVGNDQVEEPWLDEALANYSVVRYLESQEDGQGTALVQSWRQQYGERQSADPPVDSPATEFAGWDPYRRTVYIHGALFLDALEERMGTEAFKAFLGEYIQEFRYGMATTAEFLSLAQSTGGES